MKYDDLIYLNFLDPPLRFMIKDLVLILYILYAKTNKINLFDVKYSSGLVCGKNNCIQFNASSDRLADCCTNGGGEEPTASTTGVITEITNIGLTSEGGGGKEPTASTTVIITEITNIGFTSEGGGGEVTVNQPTTTDDPTVEENTVTNQPSTTDESTVEENTVTNQPSTTDESTVEENTVTNQTTTIEITNIGTEIDTTIVYYVTETVTTIMATRYSYKVL